MPCLISLTFLGVWLPTDAFTRCCNLFSIHIIQIIHVHMCKFVCFSVAHEVCTLGFNNQLNLTMLQTQKVYVTELFISELHNFINQGQ